MCLAPLGCLQTHLPPKLMFSFKYNILIPYMHRFGIMFWNRGNPSMFCLTQQILNFNNFMDSNCEIKYHVYPQYLPYSPWKYFLLISSNFNWIKNYKFHYSTTFISIIKINYYGFLIWLTFPTKFSLMQFKSYWFND